MEKEKKIHIGSIIKGYLSFLAAICIVLLASVIAAFVIDTKAGIQAAIVFVVVAVASAIFILVSRKRLCVRILRFGRDWTSMENKIIEDFPIPYAITDKKGVIILYSNRFRHFYEDGPEEGNISGLFKEIDSNDLKFSGNEKDIEVNYDQRYYRVHIVKLTLDGDFTDNGIADLPENENYLLAAYVIDETEIIHMVNQLQESRTVMATILVDNYDEVIDHIEAVKRSFVSAQIDKEISDYFSGFGGIINKSEKDKYFVLFEHRHLQTMQRNKFDLLDKVRAIDSGSDIPVTISVGVGVGKDYRQNDAYARQGLELALGRGGDQVVVKDGERVYFYGGKTRSVEKNTRVKARFTALALREVLLGKSKVVIMGHKISDPDCLGAAIGIRKAATLLGRKAYIVLNELNNSVQPILENLLDNKDYGEDAFIPANEAARHVDNDTALVIVDVNRPEIFECPELINKTKTIVMIDHHLQSGDKIENVVLSYIEPTASSASEMVAELLQYITGDVKLSKLEAEALYSGILIDTDYFTKNTGVRTFEAAAFLRKNGVDVGRVSNLFSDTLEDFKLKAETIKTAEIFAEGYALAVSPAEGVENPTIVAAQVANELLSISGVKASFVLVNYGNKVYISARSKEDVNVQLIMERMGGGGHMNVAGAQLAGSNIEDAKKKLKQTVNKMLEEETKK